MAPPPTYLHPSMALAETVPVQLTDIGRPGCSGHLLLACPLPRGVAFGTGGSLFVATNTCDETCQVSIVKITPEGVQSTVATLSGDLFAEGVAFDGAGNLFVMAIDNTDPNLASIIYKITPSGTQSTFGTTPGQSFGLAFDSGWQSLRSGFFRSNHLQVCP